MNRSRQATVADPPPARWAGIVRGLGATGLLLVLIVVPPMALSMAVGNPMPDQAVINGRLTDAAVIGMLAVVVWGAWAQLMLAVAVEAIAAVRRAPIPQRIPFTGPQQHLARRLVVTISFLLAGGVAVSVPTAAAAPATAAIASCPPAANSSDLTNHQGVPPPVARGPVSALSHGDAHQRVSGIPAQARAAIPAVGSPDRVARWYTIKPPRRAHHDTLWDIAERHLGDGLRWKEIYELNRDRPQPDGRRLTTPSLIQPGWRLELPPDAVGLDRENTAPGSKTERSRTPADTGPGPAASPVALAEQGPPAPSAAADANSTSDAVADEAPGRTGATAAPSRYQGESISAVLEPSVEQDDDGIAVPLAALTLGLSGFACTGLVAGLARRRRRAQRFRLPGERLRRPQPPAERLERQLRTANAELTVTALRGALHLLADHCHRASRPLPDLQMIQLAPSGATLHFGADEPDPPAPFRTTGPRTWTLSPSKPLDPGDPESGGGLDGDLDDPVDPYPALVALGVTGEAMVLVNLEAIGTLRIAAEPGAAERILSALALEIGTSELCRSVELALAGCPPELLHVLDRGLARSTDAKTGRRWIGHREQDVGALLDDEGVPTMLDARARQVLSDTWAPALLLESVSPTDAEPPPAAGPGPYRGACLITTRPGEPDTSTGWTLIEEGAAWRLDPPGVTIDPQQLDRAQLDQICELVTVEIEDAAVVAAPAAPEAGEANAPVVFSGVDDAGSIAAVLAVAAGPSLPEPASPDPLADATADSPAADDKNDCRRVAGPRVLVLGPVEIVDPAGEAQPGRRRRATELITYLALHPGASQHQLDEALWPGVRVCRGTRNPLVSRARNWLGTAPDGQPYVAPLSESQEYRLHPEVTCDWEDFQALATRGLAAGPTGLADLEAALTLVRGRPFLGVHPATYGWAEVATQDMISAIVDVAHALAERALEAGDHRLARWAAARGIAAEPIAEIVYGDAIRAARAAGDEQDASRLTALLRRRITDVDPDDDIGPTTALASGSLTGGDREH